MKTQFTHRTAILVLLSLPVFFGPQALRAQGYVMFTGGSGGASHAASFGVESGKFFPRENPRFLLGGEFSVASNGYTAEKTAFYQADIRNEQGLGVAAGLRLFQGVYAVGTGGISDRSERDYMTVNGNKILLGELSGRTYGSGSGQLRFVYKRFIAGAGYHSRRGVVFSFGFAFSALRGTRSGG